MSEEIKEINRIIQSISDFYKMDNALKYYLDRRKANILLNYIKHLQQKVEQLEKENEDLKNKVEQLENIRKEAIEYLREFGFYGYNKNWQDLLNILNKGSDKE